MEPFVHRKKIILKEPFSQSRISGSLIVWVPIPIYHESIRCDRSLWFPRRVWFWTSGRVSCWETKWDNIPADDGALLHHARLLSYPAGRSASEPARELQGGKGDRDPLVIPLHRRSYYRGLASRVEYLRSPPSTGSWYLLPGDETEPLKMRDVPEKSRTHQPRPFLELCQGSRSRPPLEYEKRGNHLAVSVSH